MTRTKLAPAIGVLAAMLAVILSLVSSSSYGTLFGATLVLSVVAAVCLIPTLAGNTLHRVVAILGLLLASYAATDVLLRMLIGARVLDLLP